MKNFAIGIITCLVFPALATQFSDCGSAGGVASSVQVTDCPDDQETCILKKGTSPEIVINFKSNENTNKLTAVVHGIISSIPLPFPLDKPDACKTGVSCPVTTGASYSYKNTFDVRNSYPPVSVTVRFELKDDNNSDLVCVDIPCKIQ